MANFTEVTACDPSHGLSMIDLCQYVILNSDICEGGGFIQYVQWTMCQDTLFARYLVFAFSLVCLVFFIMVLLTSADDYFSVNVASIVEHFKISQNVAGVTFMAFANGAPDFFNSLASVLSTKHPKAGLAIGELLGGITFVSLVVAGSVAMVQPFHIMRRPFIRDIAFFGITFAILLVAFLTGKIVYIWLPLTLLVLYILYAITFLGGQYLRKKFEIAKAEKQISRRTTIDIKVIGVDDSEADPPSRQSSSYNHHESIKTPEVLTRTNSVSSFKQKAINFIDQHHLFVSEHEIPEEKIYISKNRKSIFVTDAGDRATSNVTENDTSSPVPDWLKRREQMNEKNILHKIWIDVNPWDSDEFAELNIFEKVATEIVGIAGLLGLISGLSHEIIGLTVLAWSNSVGDLFSDIAVSKT
uniref:Na_Ca_ex domain-containing protein n=1 Tax=Rhabditophanes sp. KR3021 TaxID=114890 RepID=A0AC35TW19_9BILA